jgi:mono/diheme cytochrome c family protein
VRRAALLLAAAGGCFGADPAQEFAQSIKPVLVQNCGACHTRGSVSFLTKGIETDRGLWRSVAAQLRNRTMPPVDSKLSETDRLRVAQWIDGRLKATACSAGDNAGASPIRRLNRREYRNTIRDLIGVDLDLASLFPADGTGGAGFDTNGDTLYIQPLLMERYLQAAQQILDRSIVTPKLVRTGSGTQAVAIYADGTYTVRGAVPAGTKVQVDGADAGALAPLRGRNANMSAAQVKLDRGTHEIALPGAWTLEEQRTDPSPEKRALHYRLLGSEPGEEPLDGRKTARRVLASFLPKAYRRPVQATEIDRLLSMYDRAAERGDPYEERVKLALKAALVSPDFLFRMERRHTAPGIHPVGPYELASRLSYFLWSTMPDETLLTLAREGRLQDPKVLAEQVERMLDDPRARTFTATFIGQWLGTQEIGGRFMPLLTEIQSFYNADIANDLKLQPVLLFDRIVGENRNLLELLNSDYAYLSERLVKYYGMEGQVKMTGSGMQAVKLPDERRAGLLGMAGILGMTSHFEQTSPVLRGAWVLDTLLGTPVPPPPPDVPPLEAGNPAAAKLSTRERVLQHRDNAACAACHRLMDPIGFGLENFDWMGRWRDTERDGKAVDASGELPSGEKFNGVSELRKVLLDHKDDFVRQAAGKALGYALGRSLQDGDSCTVQRIVDRLAADGYRARTLLREIVTSLPFRNTQGGAVSAVPMEAPRLNITAVTAKTQDKSSHNNGEAPPKK